MMKISYGDVSILCHTIGLNSFRNLPERRLKRVAQWRYRSILAKPYRNHYTGNVNGRLIDQGLMRFTGSVPAGSWEGLKQGEAWHTFEATELGVRVAQSYMLTARRDLPSWLEWVQTWDGKDAVPDVFGGRCV